MIQLLDAELLKLRTTRTFAGFVGISIATSLLVTVLVAILTEPTEQSVLVDVYASDTSSFFILVLAVIGISGEWRHRTITSSLLAAPDRLRFLTAKALAFVAAGVALSLLIAVSVTAVGTTILSIRGLPLPDAAALVEQVVRNLAVAAALAALGVAFGALLRNQIAAVVALLVVMFVVEPLVVALAPGVGRFAPLGVLPIAAAGLPPDDAGLENVHMLGATTATLALVAWIVAILAVAAALLVRRDLE
jgi:ABC-type transport system involved in multi-copper enzyme maturation permease subunit